MGIGNGRLIATVIGSKRKCANCKSFNLKDGQEALAAHPAFAAAAAVLSPDQMGRSNVPSLEQLKAEGCTDEEAATKREAAIASQPAPVSARWSEIGACNKHNQGRWTGDKCEDWS